VINLKLPDSVQQNFDYAAAKIVGNDKVRVDSMELVDKSF
jgi:hypothetical protein